MRASITVGLISLISFTWAQNPEEAEGNNRRNLSAKLVYLVSFALLLFELAYKSTRQSILELFTKLALIMMKPIFIVNGPQQTMSILLIVVNLLALKIFVQNLKFKPNILTYAVMLYYTIQLYFYRTSHRERINSIQFAKAFLGFPQYQYYLHGFLVTLNTFSPHFIGFLLLPYLGNVQKPKFNRGDPLYHG